MGAEKRDLLITKLKGKNKRERPIRQSKVLNLIGTKIGQRNKPSASSS